MRRNPTEPEKLLWRHLSGAQLEGHKFRRQSVIGSFIADNNKLGAMITEQYLL